MRPLHFAVNLTWRCQLRCGCCWIDDLGLERQSPERPWQDWQTALARFGEHLLVDFSGGEPLLYPGFHRLMLALASANVAWAVTTNMVNVWVVQKFLDLPVGNCVSWNVSYHANRPAKTIELARELRARGYPVAINAVLHPTEPWPTREDLEGLALNWIPWQDWTKGDGTDGVARLCNAGQQHIVMDPQGNAYRCQVHLQKRLPSLGNLLDGTAQGMSSNHLCRVGCSTCYTQNGMAASGWRISMEAVE